MEITAANSCVPTDFDHAEFPPDGIGRAVTEIMRMASPVLISHNPGGRPVMPRVLLVLTGPAVCVPRTLSTSCDQAVFVDHATDASVSPDVVSLKIDRFG